MRRSRARLGESRDAPIARTTLMRPPPATNPEEAAARTESAGILHEVLRDLPDRQREAIVLRFFEELSVEETATAMNCAEGTVKATVHQALRALRAKLPQL
jgi:RNA polymerase sigma factor (sigma-70 family)